MATTSNRAYTRSYVLQPSGLTVVEEQVQMSHFNSPRVGGKLILRANPASRNKLKLISLMPFGSPAIAAQSMCSGTFESGPVDPVVNRALRQLEAETYAKFRGKLYKGSAALGVTIASYKQSREMIVSRYRQMTLQADAFERRLLSLTRLQKGRKRSIALDHIASQYLEMVFGWQPLLQDVYAAVRTVVDQRPAAQWVGASAATYVDHVHRVSSAPSYFDEYRYTGTVRHRRSALVEVQNPNRWLRERAGLNNPAAVAWDLVPWSFVVNMFVNTGQLVNSVTDFSGLKFTNGCTVEAHTLVMHRTAVVRTTLNTFGGKSSHERSRKYQQPGADTRPPLVLKLPGVSWELAAIAASLFLQKFRKVERLVNFTIK